MRQRLRKLATGLVLAVYLLTGLTPAQPFVLCLEPGGEIALEVAGRGTACPSSGETEEPASTFEGAHTGCCPCVDIPLPAQDEDPQARPSSAGGSSAGAVLAPPACLATVVVPRPAPLAVYAQGRPRPRAGLALIRTVVLRV